MLLKEIIILATGLVALAIAAPVVGKKIHNLNSEANYLCNS
jgi:hypothetical protein